jgi:transposase-like protein
MTLLRVVDGARSKELPAPPCAQCGSRLWLTRIEPREPGYDYRSFECSKCHRETSYEVEYGTSSEWVRIED